MRSASRTPAFRGRPGAESADAPQTRQLFDTRASNRTLVGRAGRPPVPYRNGISPPAPPVPVLYELFSWAWSSPALTGDEVMGSRSTRFTFAHCPVLFGHNTAVVSVIAAACFRQSDGVLPSPI